MKAHHLMTLAGIYLAIGGAYAYASYSYSTAQIFPWSYILTWPYQLISPTPAS